jgi:hypothetical protein
MTWATYEWLWKGLDHKSEFVICGDVNIDFLSDNKGHQNIMSMRKKFVSSQ